MRIKVLLLFFIVLLSFQTSWAQNPVNGGFEATINTTTDWTTAGTASATNARTGVNSLAHTTSSTSNVAHTNATTISITNNSYAHVIGWAKGSAANARASCGGTLNATTSSTAIATIGTTLTQLTYSVQNTSGSAQNFSCRVNTRSVSGSITVYWDDLIMYTSTAATPDLTKPSTASSFTNGTITSSSAGFSWTNGSDTDTGIQNTIILRTTNLSAATPVMNDQGVYSTGGGTTGPNIVSTDWTVISTSVGSGATTYTDNTVSSSTTYKYAVIHRDLAYNYSAALVSGNIAIPSGAFTTQQDGPWTTGSTWVGGVAPTSADNVIIAHNVTAGALTRSSGTSTTINSAAKLSVSGTFTCTSSTTNVNGTFQLDAGGWATGANFNYGGSSTLNFNNTSAYGVNNGDVFWPTGTQPFNVNVLQGGLTMNSANRTVAGTFTTAAGVTLNSSTLTLSGTTQINAGGYFNQSPTYSGSASTLIYNNVGSYGSGNEWSGGGSTTPTVGTGVPGNVTIQLTSNVTLAGGRGVPGNITISTSGSSVLTLNGTTGDLYIGGNLTQNGGAAGLINNSRAVFFVLSNATQTISASSNPIYFDYLIVNKPSGKVQLSATDVTINSTSGSGVQLINAGTLDLNGRSLTLNNSGGGFYVSGGARSITSTTAAQININANKSVSYNNTGTDSLTFGTDITIHVTNAAIDFGSGNSYVNGTLQLNTNGGVTNAPFYGNASTLKYWYNGSGSVYGRYNEWNANGVGTIGTTKGYPNNVQLSNTTVLDLGANSGAGTPRALAGNLTIDDGAEMRMSGSSAMSQPLTVGGDLILGQGGTATLNLSGTFGGDLKVGGNISFTGTYVFNTNNRSVYFIKNGTQTVTAPVARPSTFNYITFQPASGSTTLQLVGADMTIAPTSTGDLLTFNSSSDVFDLNGRTLTLGNASFTNAIAGTGTFKGSTASNMTLIGTGSIGTLRFTSGFQTLGTLTMTRQNATLGATLGTDLTINTSLALTNGLINLSTFNMTMASGATATGASSNSFVIADSSGELRKTYTATGSFTFPIGDNTGTAEYSPATLNFTAGSFSSAYAGMRVIDAKHPNNTATTNYITRYWAISSSGITSATYNFSGTYLASDINGSETTCDSGRWDGTSWTLGNLLGSNTVSLTGLTTLPSTNHCTGGNPLSPPEIDLQGNSTSITNGDSTPATTDHTDFGSVTYAGTIVRTFTIRNTGASALTLSGTPRVQLSGSSSFAVTTQPSSATIAAGGSLTFQITYTAGAYTAENATVSITNSDSDEGTYTFAIMGIGTPSAASDIIANSGYSYNSNIDYKAYQTATISSTSNSIDLFKFDIRDGGASADADNLPTILSGITFNVTNAAMIRTAALFSGNTLVNASPTINTGSGTIAFSELSGTNVTAADGSSAGLTLRVTFLATVTDNTQFQVTISNANVSAAGSSTSSLFTTFTSVVSSTTSNRNKIVVTADRLAFVQQPSNTTVNSNMSPSVTLAGVDSLGNRDLDFTSTISMTSTGTLSGTPVSVAAVSGLATFSSLTHTATGTGLILTAATTGLAFDNDIDSSTFNITAIVGVTGDYRTNPSYTGIVYFSSTSLSGGVRPWQKYNGSAWVDVTGSSATEAPENLATKPGTIYLTSGASVDFAGGGTYNNIYIDFPSYSTIVTTANNSTGLTIASGKTLEVKNGTFDCAGRFEMLGTSSLIVRENSEMYISGGTFLRSSTSTFEVENNAYVEISSVWTNHSTTGIWNGTENFHEDSWFYITKWVNSEYLFNSGSISTTSYNGNSALFGYLTIDIASGGLAGNWTVFPPNVTVYLSHKDFEVYNDETDNVNFYSGNTSTLTIGGDLYASGSGNIQCQTGTGSLTLNVKGNYLKEGTGDFRFHVSNNAANVMNMNIDGNFTVNEGFFIMDANSTSGATTKVNLKGNLKKLLAGKMTNSNSNSTNISFNFLGTSVQTVDLNVNASADMLRYKFFVKSGASIQTITQDWKLADASAITVESGGTMDFGFSGSTALNVIESTSSAVTSFVLNSGGTLKITSTAGITASGSGNVQTDTRTYTPTLSTFQYIGKANQVTGDGIANASNTKTIICELDTDTTQLSFTNSTGITTPGLLNIKKGQVIETTSAYITGSTGGLSMSANTLYQVATLSASSSDVIPRLAGISSAYSLTGGTIELNGAGSQILRGSRDYRNLTFSNTGTKYVSSSISTITGTVTVANSVVLDVESNNMGGSGTNLTMTHTSQYKNSGSSSKPDPSGTYTLSSGSTIEFYGTAATTVRLGSPINYANVVINGSNVSTSSTSTGLRMQAGTTFTVKNLATFRFVNTSGFSGATSTAIDNTNSPTITLETGSTIDYTGASQSITAFSPSYYNLKISGSGTKTIPGSAEVLVGNNLSVTAGTLQIDSNKLLTVTNGITTIDDGIEVKNNGNLVQITDGISDTGKIKAIRISRPMVHDDYVYWGSPVQENIFSQLPVDFDASYEWNLDGNYDGYWSGLAATSPGRGFITRVGESGAGIAQTFQFNGTPNNGVITLTANSYDDGVTLSSGNTILLGNPYPSAINAAEFITDPANLNNIGGTLYFWTSSTVYTGGEYNTNDYATWNLSGSTGVKASTDESGNDDLKPTGNIGTGQGFFAVLLADYNVTFNNSMRVRTTGDNSQFFRNANSVLTNNDKGKIWLNLSNDNHAFRQLLVAYVDGATNGYDNLYDGNSFTANEINFYSLVDQKNLVIQGRATPFEDSDLVPLGMRISNAGNYTVTLDSTEGLFEESQDIYLEDLQLGIIHDLKATPYTFTSDAGTFDSRFLLRYTNGTLGTTIPEADNNITVAVNKNVLSIRSVKEAISGTTIFDIAGRKVFEANDIDTNEFSTRDIVLNHQTLIVKIMLADGNIVTKKIVY